MTVDEIRTTLLGVASNHDSRDNGLISSSLKTLKEDAVGRNDQPAAKDIWCLETTLAVQNKYLAAFAELRAGKFYEGWCSLERVEINLQHLSVHLPYLANEYQLGFIDSHSRKFQSLFPYKIFMSPEILEIEKVCTICRQVVFIRRSCGHRVGEIYNGEMAAREVTKWTIVGTAMVEHPVQKYSVPFLQDPQTHQQVDHYDYSTVRYAVHALASPFDGWDVQWTKIRHPHSRFPGVGRNDPCPCESGMKYKKCCLPESGVLRPHCQFSFDVPPPLGTPTFEYAGRNPLPPHAPSKFITNLVRSS